MQISKEELESLRLSDIEFFARRYVELFSNEFAKITSEQKEHFYSEIKRDLYENAPVYVLDESKLIGGAAESRYNEIILSEYNVNDRAVRIHELVHSYNRIGNKNTGLRDFDNGLILKNLDEGATGLIAQLIVGNTNLKTTTYASDVELANFIINIVGMQTFIQATRGNPKILSDEVDRILGTNKFLQHLENIKNETDKLVSQSFGVDDFCGTQISKDVVILSKLKFEINRDNDTISLLYEAIKNTNNLELLRRFEETDNKFGYNVIFQKMIRKKVQFDPNEPTLASVQQEQLKREIQQLSSCEYEPINELKIELLSFLYDKIDFQKYFVDKTNYRHGIYELLPEDVNYCENFRSSIDGKNERLGGELGIVGIGYQVQELNNVIYKINNEYASKIYISDIGIDELMDKRLEIISEQLLIAQQKEILKDYNIYIRNCFLRKQFEFFDDDILNEMINDLKKELDLKEKKLLEKYKKANTNETNIDNSQLQTIDKEMIEKILKIHLDIVRGYQHQIINGQEIYMPVAKTNQELTQEQGRLFQRIEQLYEDGQLDFSTKRQMQAQLSKEIEILREKVDEVNKNNSINNQNESNSQSLPIRNEKLEKIDGIPEQITSAYERVYDQEVILIMREKYGYDYMTDEEKEEFDSKLYESMDKSKKESYNEPEEESLVNLRRRSWEAIKNQYFSNPDLDLETIIRQQEFNEIQRGEKEQVEKTDRRFM